MSVNREGSEVVCSKINRGHEKRSRKQKLVKDMKRDQRNKNWRRTLKKGTGERKLVKNMKKGNENRSRTRRKLSGKGKLVKDENKRASETNTDQGNDKLIKDKV
ncbi:hypothetical protein CDAR_622051 [Caerostris darwini]|uniref:Uncharacterized protein n=1 Tax=Caerostris darwini TaxID=1538125 RepID=A0AAV4S7L2_9ARAC|nr:hypothetical protein CDAR_622051 [Caerostris darwini]